MVKSRGRTAIRSSERRTSRREKFSVTLVLAVSSKPGPLQIKGSATLRPRDKRIENAAALASPFGFTPGPPVRQGRPNY